MVKHTQKWHYLCICQNVYKKKWCHQKNKIFYFVTIVTVMAILHMCKINTILKLFLISRLLSTLVYCHTLNRDKDVRDRVWMIYWYILGKTEVDLKKYICSHASDLISQTAMKDEGCRRGRVTEPGCYTQKGEWKCQWSMCERLCPGVWEWVTPSICDVEIYKKQLFSSVYSLKMLWSSQLYTVVRARGHGGVKRPTWPTISFDQ